MSAFAVLGGTFDPVHCGHLRVAIEVAELLALDEVRLMPAPKPRLRDAPSATPTQRIEMLHAAVAGIDCLGVDTIELEMAHAAHRTRSVDTLAAMRERAPDASISFVIGADAFARLDQWHEYQRLPSLAHLVVVQRPGSELPTRGPVAALLTKHGASSDAQLRAAPAGRILPLDVPPLDISASQLRANTSAGRSIDFLTPPAVQAIIRRDNLYQHAS